MVDPDTVPVINPINGDRVYASYGTTIGNVNKCGVPGGTADDPAKTWLLPVVLHGRDESLNLTNECADKDALAGQSSAMTSAGIDTSGGFWAPTVSYFGGKYIMHYTARKASNGRRCLYKATSAAPWGPFAGHVEFSCPSSGRWVIDADSFVDNGRLFVVFRDDSVATAADRTAIGMFQADSNGRWIPNTYRLLLRSESLQWDTTSDNDIVENPSILRVGNGRFYLFFSGGAYRSESGGYATGIADCGTSITSTGTCTLQPMSGKNPVINPYFGWSGRVQPPFKTLPGDYTNSGAMSLFRTHAGAARAVWHSDMPFFFTATRRNSQIETLCYNSLSDEFSVASPCP